MSQYTNQYRSNTIIGFIGSIFLFVAILRLLGTSLNHDAAWHFETAFIWLDGGQIGRDIVDFNPPMTLWLSTPPAAFVKMTGLSPGVVFKIYSGLILFVNLFLSQKILFPNLADRSDRAHWVFFAGWVAVFVLYPAYQFGQREHLSLALVLPYVFLAGKYPSTLYSTRLRVIAGLLAVLGIGMKPHFVLVPFFVELVLLVRHRGFLQFFRVEILSIFSALFAYLIALSFFAWPYLTEVLPTAFWSYDSFMGRRFHTEIMIHAGIVCGIVVGLKMLIFKSENQEDNQSMIIMLAVVVAYGMAAAAQNKGWYYHWMPVQMTPLLALTVLATRKWRLDYVPVFAMIGVLSCTTIMPLGTLTIDGWGKAPDPKSTKYRVSKFKQIFTDYADPGDYVYAFITSPRDIHPAAIEAGVRWADSAGVLLYTPSIISSAYNGLDSKHRKETRRQESKIVNKLVKNQPKVLITQTSGRLAVSKNAPAYLDHFRRYPKFEVLFKGYEFKETVGSFDVYLRIRR